MSFAISRGAARCATLAASCLLALLALPAIASAADPAGVVHYAKPAGSSFDRYTSAPSSTQQSWMRSHYWRMRAYAPYFDSRTGWYGSAWFYRDSYAIYTTSQLATQHPEWILRDANGQKLYIPFGCKNGTCPQYAADIGSPAYRSAWIAGAKASLAQGYKGIFVDDVNMLMRVGNGNGTTVAPIDPRTRKPMTLAAWRHYMADFMVQIRQALPSAEIVHNALWSAGDTDPDVLRELRAANLIELERGIEDSGLTGGSGRWGIETLMSFIDHRHTDGQGVILDAYGSTDTAHLYGLAGYLLMSSGRDALADGTGGTPDDWWKGYDTNLGAAKGNRYSYAGVLRRDFAGGEVLLNEPGAPTRTVPVPAGMQDLDGHVRTSVTLGPASAAVLVRTPSVTISVKPVATAARAGSSAARVRVTGRAHGVRHGRVAITFRRGGARLVRTARVRSGGRFARTVALRPGRYRVQAHLRGGARRSHVRRVTVLA